MHIDEFLFVLAVTLVAAKLFGEVAEKLGQPAVVGELLAGVVLGGSVLGVVDPRSETIHLLAEVGVIILLFEIGLETQLKRLIAVGPAAAIVALVGVILPFAAGYFVALAFGLGMLSALLMGAALTATSVGITARVLSDLGRLDDPEGQIVLGAAVLDDVLGLIILGIVGTLVTGARISAGSVAWSTVSAFGFLFLTVFLGSFLIPPLFTLLERIGKEHTLAIMGFVLALVLALLADRAGSALIIGAFAAGLVLAPTKQAHAIEQGVVRIGGVFVPIFFVAVGAAVDIRAFMDPSVLLLGVCLTVVAVVGKILAGYAPFWLRVKKLVIGVAMVPRGEVGLIFAQMGLTTGVLTTNDFSAVMMMVLVTTFAAPIALKALLPPGTGARDADIGIADLTSDA